MVKDNATGLRWQDSSEASSKPWDDPTNDTAEQYCEYIQILYKNYLYYMRLPTIQELQTLVDYSQYSPPAAKDTFDFFSDSDYWSSSTYVHDNGRAWIVSFYSSGDILPLKKYHSLHVRCVWGESLAHPSLSRNNATEIVTDKTTRLQWQDNIVVTSLERSWVDAIDYCENTLILGGHSDWRLPNINELLSIVKYSQYDPAIDTFRFKYTNPPAVPIYKYWSSATDAVYTNKALVVDFVNGGLSNGSKTTFEYYVRCVRGGQINMPVSPAIIMYLLN